MKVMINFSDLRKLEDKNKRATIEIKKLNNCISEMRNYLYKKDKEIDKLKLDNMELHLKLESTKNTTEEIKLLTEENNVLIEENNRLKTYAERIQPKFWFGDKVRIKKDTVEEFIIGRITFEDDIFLFSDTFGYYTLYEENELELITDENISK